MESLNQLLALNDEKKIVNECKTILDEENNFKKNLAMKKKSKGKSGCLLLFSSLSQSILQFLQKR